MEKIAVVTGCSSGIGLVSSIELARAGYRVVATMRNLSRNQRLLTAASEAGVSDRIEIRQLDITAFPTLPEIIAQIVSDHGRIDVLVNNAGFALGGFAEDIQLEELRAQMETNFFGHVAVTRAALPVMRRQGRGHIIMVSSISGLVANPVTSSYSASKFALEGWSEALRIETRALGIRVVLVEPGAFKTDIWGPNVKIGVVAMSGQSPNSDRARRFAEVIKTRLKKGDARVVGRLIARVAQDPNPNLRYIAGADARFRYWGKKLVPWKIYERVLSKLSRIDG